MELEKVQKTAVTTTKEFTYIPYEKKLEYLGFCFGKKQRNRYINV